MGRALPPAGGPGGLDRPFAGVLQFLYSLGPLGVYDHEGHAKGARDSQSRAIKSSGAQLQWATTLQNS